MANTKSWNRIGLLVGLLWHSTSLVCAAEGNDVGKTDAPLATLRLANGDHVAGRLLDSQQSDVLTWQSPGFAGPLHFAAVGVNTVNFPMPEKLPQPIGDYGCELVGGDMLFGTLQEFAKDEVVLDAGALGTLHVNQSIIRRLYRWNGDPGLVHFGPGGLTGWKTSAANVWRDEAGHLVTSQPNASVSREFTLPDQVRLEVELTWTKKPDFELSLGDDPASPLNSFRLEVWENDLLIACESEKDADVQFLQAVKAGPGGVHLQMFLDQPRRRMLVFASNGDPLADLKLAGDKPRSFGRLQLTNKSGSIRLERLRISRWTGQLPQSVEASKSRMHLTDGSIVYGRLKSFEGTRREFIVDDGTAERTFPENQVQDVFFPGDNAAPRHALRALHFSGLQISGELAKVEQGTVWMTSPGIREPLASPIGSLQSLVNLRQQEERPALPGRRGRLELEGTVLHGSLTDGSESTGDCLVWHPCYGISAMPLARGVDARIIYRDPQPAVAATTGTPPPRAVRIGGIAGQVQNLFGGTTGGTPVKPRVKPKNATTILHLRSGDTIPCTVTGVDDQGVSFKTTLSDATFVKHESIKVLELEAAAPAVRIAKMKKERLLILPRMQRGNPPTQLIRSINGDYLRGRLVSMDDKELRIELRLEEKTIPRDTVTRIIWLHSDEISGTNAPKSPLNQSAKTRVQTIPSDGNRLTFFAEEFRGKTLSGQSEILGNCHVDVTVIDQLLIGPAIEQAASSLAFHQWRLKHAAEPLTPGGEGDGSGNGDEGRDSSLVGKDAPAIELDLLDGAKFRLADHKGKIVILDFWASWCGPCLQAMPQVDRVADEFADQGVELIAINLEETPEKVRATLERLKLEMTVAMDQNGRIAERYGVTSIPQTVIINRAGKVARLFVGGGARFDEQVRTALKVVLSEAE